MGEVLAGQEKFEILSGLISEVANLTHARKIPISKQIIEKTISKMEPLPFETTSSMHSDFTNRKPNTELESLTGYVVREGHKQNLSTPIYQKLYKEMKRW